VVAHWRLEDFNAKNPLVKQMKWLIWTNLASTNIVEQWHLSLEVEGEVRTNYGNKDEVEGDDESKDNNGNVREEASKDPNILIWHPLQLNTNTLHRLDRLRLAPTEVLEGDE
jgi:hypothetical protein